MSVLVLVGAFVTLLLIPAVLLVLVWKRSHWSRLRRILLSVLILLSIPAQLFTYLGLRVELAGTGYTPMLSFDSDEARYRRLEQHRAQMGHQAPNSDRAEVPAAQSVTPQNPTSAAPAAPPVPNESVFGVSPAAAAAEREPNVMPEAPPDRDRIRVGEPPESWTRFRGPRWDGHYRERPILVDWPSDGPPLLWRQPAGGGYASFVFAGGWAFTIEQRREQEAVVAYDVSTGAEIWTSSWPALFSESMGGMGPRATPTWDNDRLYALGALGKLRALDALEGTLLWEVDLLEDNGAKTLPWAFAWSPLIVDDTVITLPGGPKHSVVAYDKRTGQKRWSALGDIQAYTSPMLVTLGGNRQILTVSRERIVGLEASNGKLLWEYPWTTQAGVNASQPLLIGEDRVFLSAGYGHGAVLLKIEPTTSETGGYEGLTPRLVWENRNMKNKFTSSVFLNGHIYGLDERILACIEADSGKRVWKGGRYGHGQLLLASGHLLVITETGELVLVKATPDSHQELAQFSALSGKTWNFPALSNGILLVRNASEMAAFDLRVR